MKLRITKIIEPMISSSPPADTRVLYPSFLPQSSHSGLWFSRFTMASAVAQSCSLTPWTQNSPIAVPSNGRSIIRMYSTSKVIRTRAPFSLRVRAAAQKQKRENVETPNISTPPLPVETTPLEASNREEDDSVNLTEAAETESQPDEGQQLSLDEIGQELKSLRVSGGEVSTSSQDFWGGVWEETKLVEWPQFQKVLGTTGVVVGIIFGSAILLLTVNAILAELSDQVFNGSGEFAQSWTRGGF